MFGWNEMCHQNLLYLPITSMPQNLLVVLNVSDFVILKGFHFQVLDNDLLNHLRNVQLI